MLSAKVVHVPAKNFYKDLSPIFLPTLQIYLPEKPQRYQNIVLQKSNSTCPSKSLHNPDKCNYLKQTYQPPNYKTNVLAGLKNCATSKLRPRDHSASKKIIHLVSKMSNLRACSVCLVYSDILGSIIVLGTGSHDVSVTQNDVSIHLSEITVFKRYKIDNEDLMLNLIW